jgi:hypothetical protein
MMNHFGFQDLGPAQPPEPNATLVWHEDLADGHRPHTDHVHNHNRSIDEIEYRNHQPVLTKSRGIVYSTSLRMEKKFTYATSQQTLLLHQTWFSLLRNFLQRRHSKKRILSVIRSRRSTQ